MKVAPVNRAAELAAIQKINELHALAERQQTVCSDSIYAALRAAWEAGSLLVEQKGRIARGNWALWLELNFKGNIRTVDFAARYGGDEFLICLAQTEPLGALRFADRLRKKIAQTEFVSGPDRIFLTASFGVSIIDGGKAILDAHTLVRLADYKLYEAKKNGKDRVEGEIVNEDVKIDPRFLRRSA